MEGVYFTNEVTIAVPSKGRVSEPSFRLLGDIGIKGDCSDERALELPTSRRGVRLLLARAMDIPIYVARGAADLGISGEDAIAERDLATASAWGRNQEIAKLLALDFGACRIALAAPPSIKTPRSIATALPRITRAYCRKKGIFNPDIISLQGALELAPKRGIAEAVVDQVDTGRTLERNSLRVLDVIMESRMYVIGNPDSIKKKEAAITPIVLCARAVMEARKRVMVMVNAASDSLRDALVKLLPAMESPNISPLAGNKGYSLLAAVPRDGLEDLLVGLKAAGGTDILSWKPDRLLS